MIKGAFVLGENDFKKSFSPFSVCLAVTENDIFQKMTSGWPVFSPLTRKWFSPLIFTSKHFRKKKERERERESARARERRRNRTVSQSPGGADLQSELQSELQAARSREDRREDRDLAPSRSQIAIARSRLRSRSTAWDRAVVRSRSQIDRDLAPSRARAVDREIAPTRSRSLMVFFLGLCFPFSFPNTRKYFPEIFLKCNQTRKNIFLFRKLTFPENMYFPENILRQPNTA